MKGRINQNVLDIPPSGIRKFFDVVKHMEGAISLGVGEPDFPTPWHIIEAAIYSLEQGETHYTSNWGTIELRTSISKYMRTRFNLQYNPEDQICITVGASEGIDLAMRALITPGDKVLIPEPSYVSYYPCVKLAGGVPIAVPTSADVAFKILPEVLAPLIDEKTTLLLLPYPNNPTGGIMTREDLERIAPIILDNDLIVISDEIYGELTYTDDRHVSIAELDNMYERTVVLSGFSKSFAMTGWRVGFIAGHPEIIGAMVKIHQYTMLCAPIMSQKGAREGLENGFTNNFATVAKMKRSYNRRRRVVLAAFRNMGLDCFEPEGAFYTFPCIKSTGMTSLEFCERLLEEEKVAVVPGTAFGAMGEGYVRASYAYSMDSLKEALVRIERFVKRHSR